jgi:acetolactate synthase I/II/III large subunit
LRARGVSVVFALCGDHTNPILESCEDEGIRIIDARDERGAAWMAAGYALATAEPGVVVVSNTPALTNAATALADSNFSGTPVVCITGGVGLADRETGHPGDQDQIAIAEPWSKHVDRVQDPSRAGLSIRGALIAAMTLRPGVATVEVPMDIQHKRADTMLVENITPMQMEADTSVLGRVAGLLADAQRPVIVAGSGVFWSKAGAQLQALVEGARIPVFTARAARGLISDDHELCFGFPNLLAAPAQAIFGEADVALVVGCELDLMVANGNFHPGCTLIRLEADEAAFKVGRAADVQATVDIAHALGWLAEHATPLRTQDWVARLREAADARDAEVAVRARITSSPLHPGRLIAGIAAKLPPNAIVTVDAGELALWALDAIPARAPSAFHTSSASAMGALGMGLPWAIGMKIAHPDRPVMTIAGDGSFGFTALELETSARHNAPVGVVVGNDGGWGIVRHLQLAIHGRAIASDLPRSPYELLAEFAGGVGDRVETAKQLEIAVTNALVADVPSVVNALIDASAQHPAMPLIAAMFAAKRDET